MEVLTVVGVECWYNESGCQETGTIDKLYGV